MKNFAILFVFFIHQLAFAQNATIEDIQAKTLHKITTHQSITYDVRHYSKMYWSSDTTSTIATCSIIRNEEDTFARGYSQMFISDEENDTNSDNIIQQRSREYVYDGELLTYKSQSIDDRRVYQDNARDLGGIPNNVLLHRYFLYPEFLKSLLQKAILVEKTILKKHNCYHIKIEKEPSKKYRDQQIDLWIDETSFDIIKIVEQYQYQNMDGFQYNEWQFDIESYDKMTLIDIQKRRDAILENYDIYKYLQAKDQTKALISAEQETPDLVGWSVFEEREVSLFEYLNTPVVLYFWNAEYSNSINHFAYINDLSSKYAPFGTVFIGVTSNQTVLPKRIKDFLNDEKNQQIIKEKNIQIPEEGLDRSNQAVLKILQNYHVNFANLMVNPSIIEDYGAIGYPEVVLLDETGKIVFSLAGLNPRKKIELEIELEKLID